MSSTYASATSLERAGRSGTRPTMIHAPNAESTPCRANCSTILASASSIWADVADAGIDLCTEDVQRPDVSDANDRTGTAPKMDRVESRATTGTGVATR